MPFFRGVATYEVFAMKHKRFAIVLIFNFFVLTLSILLFDSPATAQDPGWPRQKSGKAGKIIYYQPQVDEWSDYRELNFRTAFSMTPAGGQAVVGVAVIRAKTDVDVDNRTVLIRDLEITETHFPSVDSANKAKMDALVKTFLPKESTMNISLDRIVASVEKPAEVPSVSLKNDPPQIFVSNQKAILIHVDGEPVYAKIKDSDLEFLINSNFPVFHDQDKKNFYVFTGKQWLTAKDPAGTWTRATSLPKDMNKVKADKQWAGLASAIPPPPASEPVPVVFYAKGPAEVLLFQGQPVYTKIKGTNLVFASNTESDLFVDSSSNTYYYLASGRWFRAGNLKGPWTYASADLPSDFSKIPEGTPAARVLAAVPGTDEAKDAVLLAQVPTTVIVDPKTAAAKAAVTYSGPPDFKPIEGTSLFYAVNTSEKVIRTGSTYYLCLNGIWFYSSAAEGPWTTAPSVPAEIYQIPASSPVYNVTYVTQSTTSSGSVQSSYTGGYLGSFVVGMAVGAVIWNGTGYYYPPYFYYPPYGYPIYHHYPATYGYGSYYNHATGAYGAFHGVYGPYRGATGWAGYNPYTGTYSRGGTVYGPYGSRTAAGAYNPYTGTRAATRQGSSPYGQWGTSVVSRNGQAIQTGHVTSGGRTIAGARSTSGAKAIAGSGYYGSGGAVKTAGGDMYAARNGNVYKNTGSGWQSHNGSGWDSVNTPGQHSGASTANRRTMDSSTYNSLNSEMHNRQRGSAQTQNYQRSQHSSGYSGSRSGSYGGSRSGGGGRRRR